MRPLFGNLNPLVEKEIMLNMKIVKIDLDKFYENLELKFKELNIQNNQFSKKTYMIDFIQEIMILQSSKLLDRPNLNFLIKISFSKNDKEKIKSYIMILVRLIKKIYDNELRLFVNELDTKTKVEYLFSNIDKKEEFIIENNILEKLRNKINFHIFYIVIQIKFFKDLNQITDLFCFDKMALKISMLIRKKLKNIY